MNRRLQELRKTIRARQVGAFLVTNLRNIRYLAGFSGSNGLLLVRPEEALFLTDFRYQEQIRGEVKGCRKKVVQNDLISEFSRQPGIRRLRKIGFEPEVVTHGQFLRLRKSCPRVRWVALEKPVEQLRRVKDKSETSLMQEAAAIADRAFGEILPLIKPGVRELELAAELDYRMRRGGAQAPAFDTIVATGPRGALPHADPTSRKIRKGDLIVFDVGAVFEGYCSDMTRTVVVGKPTARQKEVYALVLRAQEAGLAAVKSGVKADGVDRAARKVIEDAGFGKAFGHSLGHGVGLEVHELPTVSSRSDCALQQGEMVTIEPGVYLRGWGGVRIEDLVRVTATGCDILTRTPKELVVL